MTEKLQMTMEQPASRVAVRSSDLLGCPFCGKPGEYQDVSISDEDWPGASGDWWIAGCDKCGIWLPQCEYATKQQASEAWNTRQPNDKSSHAGTGR